MECRWLLGAGQGEVRDFSLHHPEGIQPCPDLGFRLLASRTLGEQCYAVLSCFVRVHIGNQYRNMVKRRSEKRPSEFENQTKTTPPPPTRTYTTRE